jgi:AcrR family transcriptional regulator
MPKINLNLPTEERSQHHRTAIGQAQRVKTRAWIIQSAIPVFAEHGPDAPVIDDFAKAAGIARSTFYTYFQTTHELLEAAKIAISDEIGASIVPLVADERDPIVRFATASWLYYRHAAANPTLSAFVDSVSAVGPLTSGHARADLQAAIDSDEIKIKDLDHAEGIALGIMIFSLRTRRPDCKKEDERALTVISATLGALGASAPLVRRAMKKIQTLSEK